MSTRTNPNPARNLARFSLTGLFFACFAIGTATADQLAQAELKSIKMGLLTQPGIWDAGLFAAVEKGFFEEQGLEVSFVSPSTPADGLKLLASGEVSFATAHSTEVLTARSIGLPVVSVATNHQIGTAGVMMPKELGITNLSQLEGMTLGITGIPYNKVMLEHMLGEAGVDVSKVNIVVVGFAPMPLLLSKRIDGLGDAITWSEPAMYNVQIEKDATDSSTYEYFAFYENGVPSYYTFGVVTSEDIISNDPELAENFLAAWSKGLEFAIDNQQEAIDIIRAVHPEINEAEAVANLAEIARIARSVDTEEHGLGWQNLAIWEAQEAFMRAQGQIETQVDVSNAMTNEFLPGN